MFDPNSFVVGGVQLIVIVFGLVEFIKVNLDLSGKKVTVLAACMGMALAVLFELQTIIPAPYSQIYEIIIKSVTFGLAASGYYKFVDARLPNDTIAVR